MTSFIHPDFPTTHAGVVRIEAAVRAARQAADRLRGARGLVALLLAGGFSGLVVVADRLVNTWADGQVVLAWVGLWVVLFGAMLLFAEASRDWSERVTIAFEGWRRDRARQKEDDRTWRFALADPRLMAELQVAHLRAEAEAEQLCQSPPAWPFSHQPWLASTATSGHRYKGDRIHHHHGE